MILKPHYLNFEFKSEKIVLESIELFINESGDIVSDVKLTFVELQRCQKDDRDRHSFLEVEPMYITPKKLTRMSNLHEFVTDLIETSLNQHQQ